MARYLFATESIFSYVCVRKIGIFWHSKSARDRTSSFPGCTLHSFQGDAQIVFYNAVKFFRRFTAATFEPMVGQSHHHAGKKRQHIFQLGLLEVIGKRHRLYDGIQQADVALVNRLESAVGKDSTHEFLVVFQEARELKEGLSDGIWRVRLPPPERVFQAAVAGVGEKVVHGIEAAVKSGPSSPGR